jgi:hypothetical protein
MQLPAAGLPARRLRQFLAAEGGDIARIAAIDFALGRDAGCAWVPVYLPRRRRAQALTSAVHNSSTMTRQSDRLRMRTPVILVVEDEQPIRDLIAFVAGVPAAEVALAEHTSPHSRASATGGPTDLGRLDAAVTSGLDLIRSWPATRTRRTSRSYADGTRRRGDKVYGPRYGCGRLFDEAVPRASLIARILGGASP